MLWFLFLLLLLLLLLQIKSIKSNLFANTKYERKKQTENQKKSKM